MGTDEAARLTSGQLLALQLLALAYSRDQVAHLRGVAAAVVDDDLARAAAALGAAGVREAIESARERGTIVPAPRGD